MSLLSSNPQALEIDPLKLGVISIKNKLSLSNIGEVLVPDTYNGLSQELHPNGLYSTVTFGLKGTSDRMDKLGFISLNSDIIIPDIFTQLKKARSLYIEIMQGRTFAVFDKTLNDFIATPVEEGGETGYVFFVKFLDRLQPQETGSSTRSRLVHLIDKFKGKLTTRFMLVIAAGYRDIEQGDDGRMKADEINDFYLAVLRAASFIQNESPAFDNFRYQAQLAVNKVSEYIDGIIYGKHGLINSKFAKRSVRQGTRNVITSQIHDIKDLDSVSNLDLLDSTQGLMQMMAMYPDKILYSLKQLLQPMMPEVGYEFTCINPANHSAKQLKFDPDIYNLFMSSQGFDTLTKVLKVEANRTKIMTLNNYWIGALYKPPGEVSVVSDPADIPDYDPKYLHPITLAELIYIAIMQVHEDLVGTSTRPPVLGQGGIGQGAFVAYLADPFEVRIDTNSQAVGGRYPVITYTYQESSNEKSPNSPSKHSMVPRSTSSNNSSDSNTVSGIVDLRSELSPSVLALAANKGVGYGPQIPSLIGTWNDSFTVSELRLIALGLDYDGDTMSGLPVTTTDAVAEIKDSLKKASTYMNTDGQLLYSLGTVDVANNILLTLTSE